MLVRSTDGNIIGDLDGRVFTKRLKASLHMLKTPPAWAIDATAFNKQILPHADTIRVEDTETGAVYQIGTAVFDQHKKLFERRFGPQYFVILKYWQVIQRGQTTMFEIPP